MHFYKINICQVMILRFYTVYNKHEMLKIDNQMREKSQVYRKCSNNFPSDCKSQFLDTKPGLGTFFTQS